MMRHGQSSLVAMLFPSPRAPSPPPSRFPCFDRRFRVHRRRTRDKHRQLLHRLIWIWARRHCRPVRRTKQRRLSVGSPFSLFGHSVLIGSAEPSSCQRSCPPVRTTDGDEAETPGIYSPFFRGPKGLAAASGVGHCYIHATSNFPSLITCVSPSTPIPLNPNLPETIFLSTSSVVIVTVPDCPPLVWQTHIKPSLC
jgi:hypothetical protein